jgi:hypothetical protein
MKIIYTLILLILSNLTFGQFNYNSIDKSPKLKESLYQDTKKYIGNVWGYSHPLKIDDYEKGDILLDGMVKISLKPHTVLSRNIDFYYTYQVKFNVSNNNYKMILDNVRFSHCNSDKYNHCNLNPNNNYTSEFNCLSNSKFEELMILLQGELNSIEWSHGNYMKKNTLGNWRPTNIINDVNYSKENQLSYASTKLIKASDNWIISNRLLLIGISSALVGSLIYTNNPNLGKVMIGIGGVCNLTSLVYNYQTPKKIKEAGIGMKNYSKSLK